MSFQFYVISCCIYVAGLLQAGSFLGDKDVCYVVIAHLSCIHRMLVWDSG